MQSIVSVTWVTIWNVRCNESTDLGPSNLFGEGFPEEVTSELRFDVSVKVEVSQAKMSRIVTIADIT